MPQHAKGARLYLRNVKGYAPTYVILDGPRQIRTGCGTGQLREAEAKLAAHITAAHRPDTGQRDLAQIACADVMNLYNTEIAPALPSAATIGYQGAALLKFWGGKTLAEVKGSTCRAYVKFRCTQPLPTRKGEPQRFVGAATARQELKLLGRAINHWHRESPLVAVPRVTLPNAVSRRERVLTRGEVARLLWSARKLKFNHVARFILLGVYTGTRHEAILKLRWEAAFTGGHVDIERRTLYRRGASDRETSKRRPPVRIGERLATHCQRWRDRDSAKGVKSVIHSSGAPIAKMRRAWNTVVKAAGLGRDVTPHVLRHTCASWLLWGRDAKGLRPETRPMEIWDVAGIIGADASTVERVYGHHKPLQDARKRA